MGRSKIMKDRKIMDTSEKTYRHSIGKLALMFLGVLFFFYAFWVDKSDYFMLAALGIVFITAISYATSSIKISSDEIVTSRFLISKSIRWSEVARVSTRGQSLRLHNRDEDVTLSLDPQLEGYAEILDIVFSKRPELFDADENTLKSHVVLGVVFAIGFGLLMIAVSVFLFSITEGLEKFYGLIFFVMGVAMIIWWLLAPQNMALGNQTMVITYFYKKVSYTTSDIVSIFLEKKRTRNGYIYFVQLNLKSGKKLRLPSLRQGSVLTYQVLKRWHTKGTSNQPAYLT
jgi:hypothetical protein